MGGLDVLIIYSVCVVPLTVFSVGLFFSLSLYLFFFFLRVSNPLYKKVFPIFFPTVVYCSTVVASSAIAKAIR